MIKYKEMRIILKKLTIVRETNYVMFSRTCLSSTGLSKLDRYSTSAVTLEFSRIWNMQI